MKINFTCKESSPEVLSKYRKKMFKKRRKNLTFQVGDKVRFVKTNMEFLTDAQQSRNEYFAKFSWGQELENLPATMIITEITGSKTIKIRCDSFWNWFNIELFEKYEN